LATLALYRAAAQAMIALPTLNSLHLHHQPTLRMTSIETYVP
jgi:hypothetical protein